MEKLGPYTLYGRIGSGGMATVHLARRQASDEWLAIKRIHPHLAIDPDVQTMFLNEAKILSQLSHPVICGVLDYSVTDDTPYLVMRYLHGVSLGALITRYLTLARPVPVNLMAYIAATVCDGLHYAHEACGENRQPLGLVHRDISPQNIFITFGGSVHLLDFGVAKATGFARLTRTGRVKGKYAYLSPEQVTGHPVDRRSDVFSLGIVLWESLTGRHLFKRKRDIDTLRAIKTGAVPAPSELNASIPQQLDAIVARALVADRRRRFQAAEDLGGALWRFLTAVEEPIAADELSEALAVVFPHPPTPAKRARGDFGSFPGWTNPGTSRRRNTPPDNGAITAPHELPPFEVRPDTITADAIDPAAVAPPSILDDEFADADDEEPTAAAAASDETTGTEVPVVKLRKTEVAAAVTTATEVPAQPSTEVAQPAADATIPAVSIIRQGPSLMDRPAVRPASNEEHAVLRPIFRLHDVQSTLTEADTALAVNRRTIAPDAPPPPPQPWPWVILAVGLALLAIASITLALAAA